MFKAAFQLGSNINLIEIVPVKCLGDADQITVPELSIKIQGIVFGGAGWGGGRGGGRKYRRGNLIQRIYFYSGSIIALFLACYNSL